MKFIPRKNLFHHWSWSVSNRFYAYVFLDHNDRFDHSIVWYCKRRHTSSWWTSMFHWHHSYFNVVFSFFKTYVLNQFSRASSFLLNRSTKDVFIDSFETRVSYKLIQIEMILSAQMPLLTIRYHTDHLKDIEESWFFCIQILFVEWTHFPHEIYKFSIETISLLRSSQYKQRDEKENEQAETFLFFLFFKNTSWFF